jgi:CRP-like cAMP-binding protein
MDRHLRRRETFFRQGDPVTEGGILFAGLAKMAQTTAGGNEVIVRLVSAGEIITLQNLGSHPTTAEALEPSHGLFWTRPVLEGLFDRHPAFHRNAFRIMTERMRVLEQTFGELATEKVAPRLARTLLRTGRQIGRVADRGVLIGLSREDLARMTGTTMFTVSRLLSSWEADGVVENRRQAVVIHNAQALNRISAGEAEADPTVLQAQAEYVAARYRHP